MSKDILDAIASLQTEWRTREDAVDTKLEQISTALTNLWDAKLQIDRRLSIVEQRQNDFDRRLRDTHSDSRRQLSDADLRHEADMGAAIVHISSIEQALREIRENDTRQNEELAKLQTTASVIKETNDKQNSSLDKIKMQKWAVWATLAGTLWEVVHRFSQQ